MRHNVTHFDHLDKNMFQLLGRNHVFFSVALAVLEELQMQMSTLHQLISNYSVLNGEGTTLHQLIAGLSPVCSAP